VYSALSYYYEHLEDVEGFMAANREALCQTPPKHLSTL